MIAVRPPRAMMKRILSLSCDSHPKAEPQTIQRVCGYGRTWTVTDHKTTVYYVVLNRDHCMILQLSPSPIGRPSYDAWPVAPSHDFALVDTSLQLPLP